MNRLVNELLLLARTDSNELRLAYETVDLAELFQLLVSHPPATTEFWSNVILSGTSFCHRADTVKAAEC